MAMKFCLAVGIISCWQALAMMFRRLAVNVDAVAKVAMKKNPRTKKATDVAIYAAPGYEAAAIALAETKREAGLTVEFALVSSAEAALDYAKNRKISTLYQVEKEVTEVTVL